MLNYRKIEAGDDAQLAEIIRANLEKYHLNIPGTVYFDPELNHLSKYYGSDPQKRVYYIALGENGEMIGGVGAAEFTGIPDCAELQKLYLTDSAKGKGYCNLYLETHTNLETALKLYEKMGFRRIERPRSVVHGTMDHFYLKEL